MSTRSSRDCFSSFAAKLNSLSSYLSFSVDNAHKNVAAWLEKPQDRPLVVREAPYSSPGKGQLLIKNAAVAINPIDWKIQDREVFHSKYPLILGSDAAGEIVEVGEGVTGFEVGQRVFTHSSGGFQLYCTAYAAVTAAIPPSIPFENAVVLGLGTATAAAGLYSKDFLALGLPTVASPRSSKGVLLVWGGSSSVGSCAIQLAKNSGFEVFATASKENLKYLEQLGVTEGFDYKSKNIVEEITSALNGKKLVGSFDAISLPATLAAVVRIVSKNEGSKFIATTAPGAKVPDVPEGITIKGVNASSIADNEVGPAVFNDFLSRALATGKYLAKPDPDVIGNGLEYIQDGLDKQKAGVSASKIVISL